MVFRVDRICSYFFGGLPFFPRYSFEKNAFIHKLSVIKVPSDVKNKPMNRDVNFDS